MPPIQLVAEVAPGVARRVFRHTGEEQPEPAQLDVASDAVFAVVVDGPKPQRALQVAPSRLDLGELLVGKGEVGRGEGVVVAADQPLAVEVGVPVDGGRVDAELLAMMDLGPCLDACELSKSRPPRSG